MSNIIDLMVCIQYAQVVQASMCMSLEPEVDDGALYLSLCTLSVSVMQAGV